MAQFVALAGTALSAGQTIAHGAAEERNANHLAIQMRQQANLERASAQRDAIEARRQKRLAQSRVQALAGGSGGDKTVLDIMDDLEQEGELNALNALYGGESRGRTRELQAVSTKRRGKQAKSSSYGNAAGTIAQGGSSLYTRFG